MNATELLANTLSPGKPHRLARLSSSCLTVNSDANTRQDATQKLENASRENYVRPFLRSCIIAIR